ncbi:hypothetical protein ACFX2C_043891 [Malus domestica]
MTRSSQPIRANILDFDDDFERKLRRARNQQEHHPPNSESDLEENVQEEEEEATAGIFEEVQGMAMDNRTLKELSASGLDNAAPLCIQYPRAAQGKTDEFELKSSLLHHIPKYHGLSMEDPNKHLKEFEVVCSSMTPVNVDGNILKMKAFPFSLMDKAKDWLYELAPGTVTSWESMKRAFLEKFFPTSRIILLRKKISGIQQEEGESFPTYYERFKSLVASCPQHQMKEELLLQYFYEGLLPLERQMLDASAGGALVDKTPMAAKVLIANRALNAQQYEGVGQRGPPRHQVHEVSATSDLHSQLANLTSIVSQMAEGMKMQGPVVCGVCSIQGHVSEKCPQLIENGGWESANAIGFQGQNQSRHDPYSNTYNPGWRDHPNFKWRDPQQPQNQGGFRQQPPGFFPKTYGPPQNQAQSGPSASGTSLDNDALLKILTKLSNGQEDQAKAMQNQDRRVDQLEKQIGQIAEFVGKFRDPGQLPSSTNPNPKGGFETANAIMLRSGKEVGAGPTPPKSGPKEDETLKSGEENPKQPTAKVEQPLPQATIDPKSSNPSTLGKKGPSSVNSNIIPPNVPFPSRFLQSKNEEEEKDVLETFRKVQVNIPLLDAIKQIPKYAKFLKKLCTTRKRIREKEVVHVSENVSAMLQRKLPPKCKDPDFYVLDMEDSTHSPPSPLLLGRPFMKTAQTKIDVAKGAVTMAFGGDMINFKIPESIENTNDVRSCCAINVIENIGQECSTLVKKNAPRTTIAEGIGVSNKECTASTLKSPNLAECNLCASVHCTPTPMPHLGKPPDPISISISTNRLLPCMVQVPNQSQYGGRVRVDLEKHNTTLRKDHYPIPFKDPMHEVVRRTRCRGNTPPCRGVQ